jgi:signal transduction histidine kinase
MSQDPLHLVELLAVIEEASTPVRHDIRNRIASMRNLAFFVRRKLAAEENPERDPRVDEFLHKIESEVERTDEVIEVWTHRVQGVRSPELGVVQAAVSVRLAMACARLQNGVTLALELVDETLTVNSDEQVLALAVRCLLENAAESVLNGSVYVRIEREHDDCVINVLDHGPGMAEPQKCLERFESTKPGHLGLGLCIARRIAARAGGDLTIGNPERGASVSLRIPISGQRALMGEQS